MLKWYSLFKWLKILFTKKGLMKTKKSQYLFNQIFKPPTKKDFKRIERGELY